jgi:hypothetical protein
VVPSEPPERAGDLPAAPTPGAWMAEVAKLTEVQLDRSDFTVSVPCSDVGGRAREVVVGPLADEQVLVMVPVGEVADLVPDEAERLLLALRQSSATRSAFKVDLAVSAWTSFTATFPCTDGFDRPRGLTVTTRRVDGRVSLIAPPAAIAVLCPHSMAQIVAALSAATRAARIVAVTA